MQATLHQKVAPTADHNLDKRHEWHGNGLT
jgi:hypothetical protein